MKEFTSLTSSMYEVPTFQRVGSGTTDTIVLLGHADNLTLMEPYQVTDLNQVMNAIDDRSSPLARGILEAYHAGARDFWVMAVDTMDNYEQELEDREAEYYETYATALQAAYDLLLQHDMAQIIVPLDAPFNSTVDFMTPLVNYCAERYAISNGICLGMLGTRGEMTEGLMEQMAQDPRLALYGEFGKFVGVFTGDCVFTFRELGQTHTNSVVASAAGLLASGPLDRGLTGRKIAHAYATVGRDVTTLEAMTAAEAGINVTTRNYKGKRGTPFQVRIETDNTLSSSGSDFWSFAQMRLTSRVANEVRAMGRRVLGTVNFGTFKGEVEKYLLNLVSRNLLRGYTFDAARSQNDVYKVEVNIVLRPYFGIREIYVPIQVGSAT